ncbi:MAG: FAD-binding protein, partial [Candidatus Saccharimonadales bacterium]
MIRRFSQKNLANFTSLKVGGSTDTLLVPESYIDTVEILQSHSESLWFLGYGSNVLISDHGLPGTTVLWRNGTISKQDTTLVVDAGVWWDDLVQYSISQKLWGLELMSEIPSSVGGAVFGNIAAYGQQVSDTLEWVDIYDSSQKIVSRVPAETFTFAYRSSSFQSKPHLKILRAAFGLSKTPLHTLTYDSALSIAQELDEKIDDLESVRRIIVETRTRAGSIYHPDDERAERTAGSFFKNPMVTIEQAQKLASYDESGKTLERILSQSKIHGGS